MIYGFMKKTYTFAMIHLLVAILTLNAQPYPISHLRLKDGLSNDHVVSIAQDKKGFLWFATEEGLNRFDGIRFTSYYKEEGNETPTGLTGNELNCLLDDPVDSILWIGTQRAGLNAYDYTTNSFISYRTHPDTPHGLITDDITQIAPAADGNLWISTYWKGIEYFDKQQKTFTHYNTGNIQGLKSNQIWTVVEGNDRKLYIGHVHDGFSIIDIKTRKAWNYQHEPNNPNSLPGNEVNCVYKDNNGNIWVGTNKGLALFNPDKKDFIVFRHPKGRLSHRIYSIRQMEDNKLWVAMEFGGIGLVDLAQHFFHQGHAHSISFINAGDDEYGLSNPSIRCLYQDSFNNVWAGSWGGGINFIGREPALFKSYRYSSLPSTENSLNSRIASSVCVDQEGDLWIGTDGGGINYFHQGRRKAVYNIENGQLSSNSVLASLCDSKGGLWFGLFYGGIIYYNNTTRTFHPINLQGDSNIDIRSFSEDKEGNIWVSSSNGIYLMDRDTQTVKAHYSRENNLIRCIKKDSKGQVWVGFFGGGLGLYNPKMQLIQLFNVDAKFPSNTINAIIEDSHKRLWVATGEGLVCFPSLDDRQYKVFQREDGLANTHIQSVIEDKFGNIWMGTNQGISCIDFNRQTCYNYDHRDNLPSGNFSTGCATIDTAGILYFGSINGLCYFDPNYVLEERVSPQAFINNIEILGPISNRKDKENISAIPQQLPLQLKYTQNSFCLTFNVQNYALANRVEYAYKLKGLEDSWYTADNSNSVTFRNLPPGKYQFMVKTRLRNQQWSDKLTSLYITVAPPLWLTWWAKILYVLAFLSILLYIMHVYKKRLNAESLYKLEKQNHEHEQNLNNERLRFYTNITHELRTPLTLILGPLEDLQKSTSLPPKEAQKISVIHQSAIRLLNLINQILEFRKTETQNRKLCVSRGNIVTLLQETGLKYKELNQKKNVNIILNLPEGSIDMFYDKEVMLIILDNLMSNAIKYTEQGNITLSVCMTEREGVRYTEIRVSDTGYGISAEAIPHIFDRYYQEGGKHQASGTGIGLALVKNLVTIHEGDIQVESTPNLGSIFCINLLTDNSYPNALHTDSAQEEKIQDTSNDTVLSTNTPTNDLPILEVVEDNTDICTYIAESLHDYFDVHTAANGKEGLEIAREYIPDIIVSDVMMPVMDGIEMCKALKKDVRTSHIPIILLTAKDSMLDKEEGYSAGADSYLTKPFSASLLQSRINNILQSRRQLVEHFNLTIVKGKEKSAVMAESLNKLDNEFIAKINKLIEEGLSSDKIDISYLSDKMCMSSSTLYRKMKALTGLSTNEYIRKMKMKYAEQLLLEGKYNISEIAFKVGINNLFYFRQCFKDEFGDIPSEYLKKLKNDKQEDKGSPVVKV